MSDNPQTSAQTDKYIIELMKETLPETNMIITNLDTKEIIYVQNKNNG